MFPGWPHSCNSNHSTFPLSLQGRAQRESNLGQISSSRGEWLIREVTFRREAM